MPPTKHYGPDHLEDLLTLLARGQTITASARELGMSRRTATRLLREFRERQGWKR